MAAAKARLLALLDPALVRLQKNLNDADGWVGTKAVDQVLRYTDVKGPEKPLKIPPAYDPAKFAKLTDDELETLRGLLAKCLADPDAPGDRDGDISEETD